MRTECPQRDVRKPHDVVDARESQTAQDDATKTRERLA